VRKYILKRIALLFLTFFIIVTVSFVLISLTPREIPNDKNMADIIEDRWEALGYDKPIAEQYFIYLKNVVTKWDFGTSWYVDFRTPVWDLLVERLPPTIIVNLLSLIISIPIGLILGVYAARKQGRWQDHLITLGVMLVVSVPSYVYAFIVQYVLGYRLGLFPLTVYSLDGGGWLSPRIIYSMLPAVLALSFGEVAGLSRFTRAEMCEAKGAEYMTFARAKGISESGALYRHALPNALVPILPTIIGSFIGILAGSIVIENIFSIPGVGQLYLRSITLGDYDVFMMNTIFYTFLGLLSALVIDISYWIVDPRIRIGEA
jgi:ABC-type dipeptide/oligopeptide/nickel transport system permease component